MVFIFAGIGAMITIDRWESCQCGALPRYTLTDTNRIILAPDAKKYLNA